MKLLKNQIKDYSQEVASLLDLLYSAHEMDWDLIYANIEYYEKLKTHLISIKDLFEDKNSLLWPNAI